MDADERSFHASTATKLALEEHKKVTEADQVKKTMISKVSVEEHQKKIRKEWQNLQAELLKALSLHLRLWRYTGNDDSWQDLYEILEASDAALKAESYDARLGLDLEAAAQKAAEQVLMTIDKSVSASKKSDAAKKAAMSFITKE